ncbi:MAG: UDP-N-acetylmuramoyl-tripeptide--D-alanyl-D-alanine ligase [Holosporaceae bacterium]|jgi:UDP-N-acetylmuramoyl-tripeptide--D-alanyl-D-alanine ligase|nr:UDP-N-acetylmuramoyl-tripeptide--D-alanyl-D-alanine ligase [Holosporaceae bacterium]
MIFSKNELSEIFNQAVAEDVSDICVNSNDAKSGDLFVALTGERTDGHNFINRAFENGAALALSEKRVESHESHRIINVTSTHDALLKLAKYNLERCSALYIGVTGSVGKTTTKDLIFHILSRQLKDQVYVTRKNFNSQTGLPICAATMPTNTKIGIFEMGMSEIGDIKKLVTLLPPSISVISKICEAHAKFFDSVWGIAEAKSEIFETREQQKAAIIPEDSPYTHFLKRRAIENGVQKVFTFGSSNANADAKIIDCKISNEERQVIAEILGTKIEFTCSGNFSIENSLSAILCAHIACGAPLQNLADEIYSFHPPSGRGVGIYIKSMDVILVDDSYNACFTSTKSAIESLSKYQNSRKILVIGDMLELGKNEVFYHENLSATLDKFGIDIVFACGHLAKKLFDNLRDCKKGTWCENSSELAEKVLEKIQKGDCILVKGSNSMKMNRIVEAIKSLEE